MRNEYRHEMEDLGPRPEELERLYALIEGGTSMKQSKRLGCRAVAAIVACAVLMVTAAAAAVPTVWEILSDYLGAFAPYATVVEGAVNTDQGIEIQVLSALSDDRETRVYFSVRDVNGDRLNQFLTLNGTLVTGGRAELDGDTQEEVVDIIGFGSPFTRSFKLVSYDEETKTALFSAKVLYEDTLQPAQEAKLSITGMNSKQATLYGQDLGSNISCAAVTGAVLDSLPAGEDDMVVFEPDYLEGGEVGSEVLPDDHVVLAPGQTPMVIKGTEDIRISSMGFASDGCFHIRLEFADGVEPATFERVHIDQETGVNLCAGEISSLLYCDLVGESYKYNVSMYTCRQTLVGGGMDITFPLVTMDMLEELQGWEARLYGNYIRPGIDVEGNWSVEFPLDYYPSATLDWTGEISGWQVRTVTVSSLTVTMYSNNPGDFLNTLYAVKKDGTTIAGECSASRYVNLDAYAEPDALEAGERRGYDAFNTWKFEEPVDIEDLVSLTLNGTTIPVTG